MKKQVLALVAIGLIGGCAGGAPEGRAPAPRNPHYNGSQGLIERTSAGSPGAAASPVAANSSYPAYQGEEGLIESEKSPKVAEASPPPKADYKVAMAEPLSTFSADVDTASYANLRRSLKDGARPSPSMVRVEEMVNYFAYQLPEPKQGQAFALVSELSDCPWNKEAKLLRLAIRSKSLPTGQRPPCNLVFLVDVSGSMSDPNKLPLLKESLKTLVANLNKRDRISLVTYADGTGLALPSTPASEKSRIMEAIDNLAPGGGTNGEGGLELAYKVATEGGTETSVNRVILATDGDFNIGPSSDEEMKKLIEEKRKSGISLSVLGFGGYASNDSLMETLADNGNGNYASIDSLDEARKVLVKEAGSTMVTVAKDVKFQIAFNPNKVEKYRLIGYKNRLLANEDFDNDAKDAGDLGAGHTVTVLYELIPAKEGAELARLEEIFSEEMMGGKTPTKNELALVKLRYKPPTEDESVLLEVAVLPTSKSLAQTSADHRWAVAVGSFGLSLDGDAFAGKISLDDVMTLAESAMGKTADPTRGEFLDLVRKARELST